MLKRIAGAVLGLSAVPAFAQLPTPDRVVIVIEENTAEQHIIGNAAAPYINSLANAGANFSNFYAITHPSQPNYLQLFSGSAQGVTGDATPTNVPYTTPNWGAALLGAGYSFGGYSETQPSVGFTGDSYTTDVNQNQYVRKHNPWVNWQATGPTPGANQLPSAVNMPFSSFPNDYSLLPKVSVVVPNEQNDMHDGTIGQADTWLSNNLSAYANWAMTHNSLLIVTWDEDDHSQNNKIPTLFYGPMVRNVVSSTNWNLHNLARTVEDMYGLTHSGVSANVAPIQDIWTTELGAPVAVTKAFRQGVTGYTGGHDTWIESANPTTTHGTATTLVADGSPSSQGLVRFENIVGSGAGQIPAGSTIKFAKLTLVTGATANDQSAAAMQLHRMMTPWDETSTWNSKVGGILPDGAEAALVADGILTPTVTTEGITFDVTTTLQAYINGAPNYGWVVLPTGTDGWRFNSNEFGTTGAGRPLLEVTYVPEGGSLAIVALLALCCGHRRKR
jgi:hypothetical protein